MHMRTAVGAYAVITHVISGNPYNILGGHSLLLMRFSLTAKGSGVSASVDHFIR